jgi:NAD(P)-dependent dehydrogenase (short-subunit alcohol dehydrogenase family)
MSRIFITGSADGLGLLAAQQLVKNGHKVTVHGRNEQRAKDAQNACPGAEGALIGDLSSMAQTKKLAEDANKLGTFDCVVHNAALLHGGFRKTDEGLPSLVAVNVIAPYILTCLMNKPKRLVFLSSDSHYSGHGSLDDLNDLTWKERGEQKWSDWTGYGDSKLYNNFLANWFARHWPEVSSNSFHPGWMPTKMGGSGAPGDFKDSIETYVMLAEGVGDGAGTGRYFNPARVEGKPNPVATDNAAQDKFIKICEEVSGVSPP